MIYTVTLNPAMDYFVALDSMNKGGVNRAAHDHKAPGGKGINVSRVLKRIGHPSTALGFIGGFTGEYIKANVEADGVHTSFIEISGDTRINIKLKADVETEVNGVSPAIAANDVAALEEQLTQLKANDVVVFAGSVPPSLETNVYAKWSKLLKDRGVSVFIDTSGKPLEEAVAAQPDFIKPNQHELAEFAGEAIDSLEAAVPHAKALVAKGIGHVFVTFAGDGALLATEQSILLATTPKGTVKNSVGAGDSVVAGFIGATAEGMSLPEAFRFAVASGSATAFSTGFAERTTIEALMDEVAVTIYREG
ncbi:1-phosphofructokinase [Niallia circulans]|jgi:1-phosphofructokinase|uniref:1-phosphofructokinase n=1 Tax=Shouchella clausii TaxID=79880 RepID=UPI000BA5A383|nr:1-phosphofructokinase [Shouchella clausii]SPT77577.1 1-phosphofructokinase [Niallia circulans]MCM3548203.1 1-phosphofructokinase [Shouchella clausii]MCY1104956.1 1-phosphofructokinase [Shouchella clausii]PAD91247.1 1-phosphofructokinase [Shouchella clausii]PAF13312.1 1-phosphofructokinase [Shouchella clausii]